MADAADGFEFHLKFPVPIIKNFANENDKDSFFFVCNEEKLPVVILFGWAGCKDKHLAKYSAIYEDKSCITLRCTPPVVMTFLRHDQLRKLGEKLLDLLQKKCLDKHPIFFHVFSNGGAFFYQNVSSLLEKKKLDLDSIFKGLLKLKKPQTDPINLDNEPFTWPQLFIYSKDDELVKFEDVEKFAEIRSGQGVKVKSLCFTSSPHVQHLMTHRTLYIDGVITFLKDCLKRSESFQ